MLLYQAWVVAYLSSTGTVRAILLMLGADWRSICTFPLAAIAFRYLWAVVNGGLFTHRHIVVISLRVVRKRGS